MIVFGILVAAAAFFAAAALFSPAGWLGTAGYALMAAGLVWAAKTRAPRRVFRRRHRVAVKPPPAVEEVSAATR